jgi:ribosomal protein S18 acetylase RimI-like enzyme
MLIRHIELEDAAQYLTLHQRLDEESIFRLYEPGENEMTLAEQQEAIKRVLNSPNSTILVAESGDKLVGYLLAEGRSPRRICHTVHISLAILREFTGRGVGTMLFAELERWARDRGLHRLQLTVMVNNPAGIALYKKMGFEVEGIKRHSLLVDGEYIDDIYMAKLI